MRRNIPDILKEHLPPFNWEVQKVWNLKCKAVSRKRMEYDYLLHLPLWTINPGEGMLFNLKPLDVISDPESYPHQKARIDRANLSIPLDFLIYGKTERILDGVHRLAKLYLEKKEEVLIRYHDEQICQEIMR